MWREAGFTLKQAASKTEQGFDKQWHHHSLLWQSTCAALKAPSHVLMASAQPFSSWMGLSSRHPMSNIWAAGASPLHPTMSSIHPPIHPRSNHDHCCHRYRGIFIWLCGHSRVCGWLTAHRGDGYYYDATVFDANFMFRSERFSKTPDFNLYRHNARLTFTLAIKRKKKIIQKLSKCFFFCKING